MNIGAIAKRSGLPAKTIRYYESIGLIPPALRSEGNYRTYTEHDLQTLWSQAAPLEQALPHDPQWRGSDVKSAQSLPQSVKPAFVGQPWRQEPQLMQFASVYACTGSRCEPSARKPGSTV